MYYQQVLLKPPSNYLQDENIHVPKSLIMQTGAVLSLHRCPSITGIIVKSLLSYKNIFYLKPVQYN